MQTVAKTYTVRLPLNMIHYKVKLDTDICLLNFKPMKRIVFLFALLLSSVATSLYAQEICNNGIDDDSDGFIDCFDNQCANDNACNGSYIGNDALCEAKPSQFPAFQMTLDWASPNRVTNHLNRMSIGDLDRDGIPEVVVTNIENNNGSRGAYILRGNNGQIKHSNKSLPFKVEREVAIANLDNDNCAEIFLVGREGDDDDWYLHAYNCDLSTRIWKSAKLSGDPGLFGLADFNGDGQVELYFRDIILNAHTGVQIANSSVSFTGATGSPVAVNIVGDDNLELVLGLTIFTVNIGAGTITEHSKRSEYFRRNLDGTHTSVADFNLDGNLDIIASGSNGDVDENTTIFFWDVANNTLKTFTDLDPDFNNNILIKDCSNNGAGSTGTYYKNGWHRGTGRINIADADGDGQLNAAYVSGKYLYALDENLELLWRKTVSEETSGYTGCSMFDFNGDGKTEIIYRDEGSLYIINGSNGSTYTSQPCVSRTARDYPIVADIDADGQSELCVTCGFNDQLSLDNFCDISYSENSHVRVYRTDLEPWVPARRVWNQNAYFNVNVNDDLTIPKRQQNTQKIFSQTGCDPANPRPTRPLNTFLNQSPFLNSLGCPKYASPDLSYVDGSLTVDPPTCPETDFTVSFTIENLGDVTLNGNVPISFYKGNPLVAGAIRLNTIITNVGNLLPGNQFTVTNATVTGDGSPFTLFVAVNDSGTTTPLTFPNSSILECDYDNVVSIDVDPLPVSINAELVQNNIKCVGSVTPDNGSVRAFVPIGATENTTDYDFFWSNGASATAPPAFTGPIYSGLDNGTFTVFAVHKTANCSSDTASVDVIRIDRSIPITIEVNNHYTNCLIPNGELEAAVTGEPLSNFDFDWFIGNDPSIIANKIGVNEVVSGLLPGNYTVLVTDKNSGCQAVESLTILDQTTTPSPTITKQNIACSNANSGSVSATVGGVTNGFTFKWYNGSSVKPAPDFTGSSYINRAAGSYTLVVTNNVSQCSSAPITETIVQTTAPTVSVTKLSDQSSCDETKPNGAASANVGGTTTGFNFQWFRGQNTSAGNLIVSTPSVAGLEPGTYTVKATNALTGCSDTEIVTINLNVTQPSLLLGVVGDLTSCRAPDGSITVGVTLDTPADYDFAWYIGNAVDGSPDFATTTNTLSGLTVGTYTVQATHKTKFCTTAPISANVADGTPTIDIQQRSSVQQLPTDCNATNGILGVEISAAGNTGGFRVDWFKNASTVAFFTETTTQFSTASNLQSANYRVRATNLDNDCFAEEVFALPFADAHILSLVTLNDVTTCAPANDGSLVVMLLPTPAVVPGPPPVSFNVNDYVINLYSGLDDTGTQLQQVAGATGSSNGDGSANYTFNNLTPGNYTLVAIEDNALLSGCKSVPVVVEIVPFEDRPEITAPSISPNTNCIGVVLPNGQIEAIADASSPTLYNFVWFDGATTSATPLLTMGGTNNNTALNLDAGQYTVEVTNIATQCQSNATFTLNSNPPIISLSDADLTIDALTRCDVTNAGAQVNQIRENGVVVPLTNYAFEWFNASMSPIGATNAITNQTAGTYFVTINNTVNNCSNNLYEVVLEDQTIGTVTVSLTDFTTPTRCLQPANDLGELVTTAGGNSITGYTFTWHDGNSTANTVVGNTGTLSAIVIPGGQTSTERTIHVLNNSNQCSIVETFMLPLEVAPLGLNASAASPMTSCVTNNGSVFSTVTTAGSDNYIYNWSIGNLAKAIPDFTGKEVDNLAIGTYTIQAVDNADAFCVVGPITVTIEDGRQNPVIAAVQASPLTVCDLSKADGVANVTVTGNIAEYTFEWYVGNTVSGTPFYTGIQAGSLEAITYTVEATHVVTGCRGEANITIGQNILSLPAPTVTVLSNVTQCDIAAILPTPVSNGALTAAVNGITHQYIFDWSDGSTINTPADYTGEIYSGLPRGVYAVIATSRITGCVSPPATGEIIEDLDLPDFDFSVINSTCDQDNGFISFNMTNGVSVSTVEWFQGGNLITTEPVLMNVSEGIYTLRVRSSLGCPNEKEVSVGTEIRPFNGVSRNGDGRNDLFAIDCIESFPTNLVKIFNRAGTLVYEAPGYDNIDVYFDGKSNKGISPLGNNLPDGTYFYVIDKGDGSKPVAGYLEIVN